MKTYESHRHMDFPPREHDRRGAPSEPREGDGVEEEEEVGEGSFIPAVSARRRRRRRLRLRRRRGLPRESPP